MTSFIITYAHVQQWKGIAHLRDIVVDREGDPETSKSERKDEK